MVSLATETATRPARPRGTMHTVRILAGKELREGLRNAGWSPSRCCSPPWP